MQFKTTRSLLLALSLTAAALAAQAQTTPATESMSAAFKRLDANGDGKLSKVEVAGMPDVADRFVALDKDKDGALSMEEFSAAFTK